MNLVESLKNLGLNDKEAKVYVALLQLGQGSAYAIAKLSGLKKSTTYVILEDLIDKAIVKKVPRLKVMQYIAIPPTELFAMARTKLINAEQETLAELKAISNKDERKMRVSYYEGVDELKNMYQKQLKEDSSQKYFGFYGKGKGISHELKKELEKIDLKFKNKGIKREGFLSQDGDENNIFSVKNIGGGQNYDSNISIEVSKKKTYIFSSKNLEGMVINSPDLANALEQIFKAGFGDGGEDKNKSDDDLEKVLV
jgi:sugar-specific transcriptional regulator TrmB